MVQMNDVRMVYGNTEAEALSGVSFTINEGEFVFLVGPSGSGKTTIIKLITGELSPTSGQITVNGFDMQGIKRRKLPKLRRTLGVIFQDFRLIDKMTVYENVAFAMRVVGASNKEIRRRVPQVLELVGLVDREKRYPAELSGGEQQRVAIARALVNNPRMIIADEPISALDVSIQAQVLNLLHDLQERFDLTYLFISHDLSVVEMISDRIAVMYLGFVVETAPKEALYKTPLHPYTQALLSAVPIPDPRYQQDRIILEGDIPSTISLPKGCPFATRCKQCKAVCMENRPETKEVEPGHFVACHLYD